VTSVVAGTIARQRGWIAQRHSLALANQTRRPDDIFYIVNDEGRFVKARDSEGREVDALDVPSETAAVLAGTIGHWYNPGPQGWEEPRERRFLIEHVDTSELYPDPGPADRLSPTQTERRRIDRLAYLRNYYVDRFLAEFPNATHLWSVDSDVLPDPDVLARLLRADRAIVGARVRNSPAPEGRAYNFWMGWDYRSPIVPRPRRVGTEHEYVDVYDDLVDPTDRVVSSNPLYMVSLIGACVLIRRDVLESGVRYADDRDGEDIPFCKAARTREYSIYIDLGARTSHVQRDGSEWR